MSLVGANEPDSEESADHADRTAAAARLDELRTRITRLDEQLIRLIGERRDVAVEIGRVKATLGLPVMDPVREANVVRRAASLARELGIDPELARDVIWRIIAAARDVQEDRGRPRPGAQAATPAAPPPETSDEGRETG